MQCKFTVLFEDPFWVGVVEKHDEAGYSVAKFTFGKEPSEAELLIFAKNEYKNLNFSKPAKESQIALKQQNYKRIQREIKKEMEKSDISNKAHEAMRNYYEQNKQKKKLISKEQKEEEEKKKYLLQQMKKKQKKKGH